MANKTGPAELKDSEFPNELWMSRKRTHGYLGMLEYLKTNGHLDRFNEVSVLYHDESSWSMNSKDFGEENYVAKKLLVRLNALGVDVRRTEPNFLWFGGVSDQSLLGKTICVKRSHTHIYIDLAGPNSNLNELMDTLAHEAIHSTGPIVGRWTQDKQPVPNPKTGELDASYVLEEAIAMVGAMKLLVQLGFSKPIPTAIYGDVVRAVYVELGHKIPRDALVQVVKATDDAVALLDQPVSIADILKRSAKVFFATDLQYAKQKLEAIFPRQINFVDGG